MFDNSRRDLTATDRVLNTLYPNARRATPVDVVYDSITPLDLDDPEPTGPIILTDDDEGIGIPLADLPADLLAEATWIRLEDLAEILDKDQVPDVPIAGADNPGYKAGGDIDRDDLTDC